VYVHGGERGDCPAVDGVRVPDFVGVTNFDDEWEEERDAAGEIEKVGARHSRFLCPFMAFPHVLQVLDLPLTDAAAATAAAVDFAAAAGDAAAAAAAHPRAARKLS
jgi:hypothetical protein